MSTHTILNNQINIFAETGIIARSEPNIKIPNYYVIDTRIDNLIHEEEQLADELENYLIESLIQDIFYSNNYIMRVSALQQLNSWIDQSKIKRIFRIIAKNEKNPELRNFAKQLLELDY
ncbi:MAG: hypothetical protein ACW99A_23530 [Candidatus Kariarchaeaceae archaeon]|jgi:hypothetical protein